MAKRKRRTQHPVKQSEPMRIPPDARIQRPPRPKNVLAHQDPEIEEMMGLMRTRGWPEVGMPAVGGLGRNAKQAIEELKALQKAAGLVPEPGMGSGRYHLAELQRLLGLPNLDAIKANFGSSGNTQVLMPRTPEQYVRLADGLDKRTARHEGIPFAGKTRDLLPGMADMNRDIIDDVLANPKSGGPPAPNFLEQIIQALQNFHFPGR